MKMGEYEAFNRSRSRSAFPSSVYPEGTGATPGLPRFGVDEIAGGFAGFSGTSVERFADSAVPGGVFEGSAGGGCRRFAIGLRAPHPEEIIPNTTRVAKK